MRRNWLAAQLILFINYVFPFAFLTFLLLPLTILCNVTSDQLIKAYRLYFGNFWVNKSHEPLGNSASSRHLVVYPITKLNWQLHGNKTAGIVVSYHIMLWASDSNILLHVGNNAVNHSAECCSASCNISKIAVVCSKLVNVFTEVNFYF